MMVYRLVSYIAKYLLIAILIDYINVLYFNTRSLEQFLLCFSMLESLNDCQKVTDIFGEKITF